MAGLLRGVLLLLVVEVVVVDALLVVVVEAEAAVRTNFFISLVNSPIASLRTCVSDGGVLLPGVVAL